MRKPSPNTGQTLELEPRSGRTHYRLARLLTSCGKLEEAIDLPPRPWKCRPKEVAASSGSAVAYQRQGELRQAMEYVRAWRAGTEPQSWRSRPCDLELYQQSERRRRDFAGGRRSQSKQDEPPEQPKGGRMITTQGAKKDQHVG